MRKSSQISQSSKSARSTTQIFELIRKSLENKGQKLAEVYFNFDLDGDSYLNQAEFSAFLKNFIPDITQDELNSTFAFLNNYKFAFFLVSFFQLSQVIQDDPTLIVKQDDQTLKDFLMNYQPTNEQQQQQVQQEQAQQTQSNSQSADLISHQIDENYYTVAHPKTKGMKEFVSLFHKLVEKKQKFEDSDFPANSKSLGQMDMSKHKGGEIVWKRPSEFPKTGQSSWALFVSDGASAISPDDIVQGELGDCYFLAAISALSNKFPQSVEDLFITKKANEFGIYAVYLCIGGIWEVVWIDDYFPCYKNTGPIFCQSKTNELWVMVLEKAWAKVFGSYNNIIAGHPAVVLRSLTGGITWTISTDDENFEEKFKEGVDLKCVMCSGTKDMKEIEKLGFIEGHAYSVLKIYDDPELQAKDKNLRLVKLRNPWGEKEWNGNWSDSSPLWTPKLKEKYKVENRNDGVFYMSMTDYRQCFDSLDFVYFKDYYKYQSFVIKTKLHHAIYFEIDVQKKGEYYFSVIQESMRFHNISEQYQYSNVRMAFGQLDQPEVFATKQSEQQEMWMKVDLKNRKYYLYVKVNWFDDKERDIVVTYYADNTISMKQCPKVPNLLNSIMMAQAKKLNQWQSYKPGIQKASNFSSIEQGY